MNKNQAKTKRSKGKNRVQVPWNNAETANDIYTDRKGSQKRAQAARRLKKILEMSKRFKVEQEKKNEESTDTVSSGKSKEDILVDGDNSGVDDSD